MKRFYLAYADRAIWPQAVAKLPRWAKTGENEIWPQPVANLTEQEVIEFLAQLVAEIPWGHHRLILDKIADPSARLYYLRATARFGWSRNVLLNQIKAGAYERAVEDKKTHNFPLALPGFLVEQADEMLKSSYNLEFLGIRREVKERELEDRLISRLQAFLLELGAEPTANYPDMDLSVGWLWRRLLPGGRGESGNTRGHPCSSRDIHTLSPADTVTV